ncbi:DUF1028 domain-containing protein [Mycolicibacillus trivialis]|uniref:DUF1028 domain-containing protein n=1 Tax=Mycolicibacillus trivialis TaxID=1798 RepID=A0A1X2EG60_9MYCO|nr:DUF1028 domain-containing protein [Mycolicibacillus trivialis]ORX01094.1 hypothetical protein AWC30_14565 [Mycolicibacillus trivialis]
MTYSVVLRDPDSGALGVAAQSHYLAVGAVVPWARAGVGAVASQAIPDPRYGAQGLAAMDAGATAPEALRGLLAADVAPQLRQVAMVDAAGRVAVHTGERCIPAAGARHGAGWSVQGNMLADEAVLDAMAAALTEPTAPADLSRRLLAVLRAGEDAGGDVRGSQAAALRVVTGDRRADGGVLVDLRVDDAVDAVAELDRLLSRHEATTALGAAFALIIDDAAELPAGLIEAVSAGTRRAEQLLGANPEPALWRAVLLARAGRPAEARTEYLAALRIQPRLHDVGAKLAAVGFLPETAATTLCADPACPPGAL